MLSAFHVGRTVCQASRALLMGVALQVLSLSAFCVAADASPGDFVKVKAGWGHLPAC